MSDILYIESQKEYIRIVTTKTEYLSKMSTNEIEDILPPNLFKRIHRSYIVSVNRIDSYTAEMVEINLARIACHLRYSAFPGTTAKRQPGCAKTITQSVALAGTVPVSRDESKYERRTSSHE